MNAAKDTDGKDNTWIYMIGSIRECPAKKRDKNCCYQPLLHLSLKEASQAIHYLPVDIRVSMVNYCKDCSFQKENLRNFDRDSE